MLRRALRQYVAGHRRRFLETRVEKVRAQSNSHTFLPIPHPYTLFAYFGQRMGRDASHNIRNSLRDPKGFFLEKRRGTTEVFGLWVASLTVGSVLDSTVGSGAGTAAWTLLFFGGLTPLTYSYLLARLDFRRLRRLTDLAENPTPEAAQTAFEKLDATQPLIRRAATELLADICAGSPGKLIKTLDEPPESVIRRLVEQLYADDTATVQNAASCLRWLARDYPDRCTSYVKPIAQVAAESDDSTTQRNLTLALGLIAEVDGRRASGYAKAIAPAVNDPDAEVRAAAAAALGHVPQCDPVRELVDELSDDPAPPVRQALEP